MLTVPAKLSDDDKQMIEQIATRAREIADTLGCPQLSKVSRNITFVHTKLVTLDLRQLLATDNVNFVHDVWGIDRHLNRKTGQFVRAFRPRFAIPN